jgi:hypothetical protein
VRESLKTVFKDEWASTLLQVFHDDDERTRRSERATRFIAEELDPVRVAQKYVSLYEVHAGFDLRTKRARQSVSSA